MSQFNLVKTQEIYRKSLQSKKEAIYSLKNKLQDKTAEINKNKGKIKTLELEIDKKNQKITQIQKESISQLDDTEKQPSAPNNDGIPFKITAYTAFCNTGCSGITRTGYDVSDTIYYNGRRIVAVDKDRIPLYSLLKIHFGNKTIKAIALDTGGAINGNHIDLLVGSRSKAIDFGVKHGEIEVVRRGK